MKRRNWSERRARYRDPEFDNGERSISDSDWIAGACLIAAIAVIAAALWFW